MNERIKDLRKQLGKSQATFAEDLGLSGNYIYMVENGMRDLSDRTISDIVRVYHVSELWLRKGEGEMFSEQPIEEEIAAFAKSILDFGSESFQVRFIHALSKLTPEGWAILEGIAKDMQEEQ